MTEDTSIIIHDDLFLDTNTSIISSKKSKSQKQDNNSTIIVDLDAKIDRLELAINDLESSLDPRTTSSISKPNREGIYEKMGLITNIVIGVIIALLLILLIV